MPDSTKGLKELGELVGSYQTLKDTGRGVAIVDTIMDKARICNLDKDINFPETAKDLGSEERDTIVGKVYIKLMEIESRLLPCGLHVIGKPPSAEEAIATLVNIASLDREEESLVSLPRILANSIGRSLDEIFQNSDRGILADVELLNQINQVTRTAVAAMVHAQVDEEGRVSKTSMLGNLFNRGNKKDPGQRNCTTWAIPRSTLSKSNPCLNTSSSASSRWWRTTNWVRCCWRWMGTTSSPAPAATQSAIPMSCPPARTSTPSTPNRSPRPRR